MINIEYLEEARKNALMTITDVSVAAEISATTYRKILDGEEVTAKVIKKLIKALKLDKDRLLNSTK